MTNEELKKIAEYCLSKKIVNIANALPKERLAIISLKDAKQIADRVADVANDVHSLVLKEPATDSQTPH